MRIKTGTKGFDDVINGGLIPNRIYVLSGPPGSGKTTFGVQFLAYGASTGAPGLYVSLTRGAETTFENMSGYHINIPMLTRRNELFFKDVKSMPDYGDSDTSISPSTIYAKITDLVNRYSIKRLVIDSMSTMRFSIKDHTSKDMEIGRFIQNLSLLDCTTILISEMVDPSTYSTEQYACDGLIFLHNFMRGRSMTRAIQIIKMCGTAHDCEMRKLDFTENGLRVSDKIV
ncbi:MAG TPA: ATPase [Methanosarcinales archaeon]|nr:ATPase [Methanosarcinales archaeon]